MQPVLEKAKTPVIVILFFFACLYVFTKVLGPIPLSINSVQTTKSQFFTVQGNGEEKSVPDTAKVSLGVTVEAPTADEAKNQMNEITNKVVAELKALGIEEKDIKTTNFNVYESPQPVDRPLPAVQSVGPARPGIAVAEPFVATTKPSTTTSTTSFTGSQNIEVTTKTIELANRAIDVASANGANALGTPQFVVNEEKRKQLVKAARKKAIADAKAKATELANEAGIKLGKVVDIQEFSDGGMYYGGVMMNKAEMSVARDQATELNPGEDTVRVNVTLSYETL